MKVVWGKFGTGVDLIVCAISSYWWVPRLFIKNKYHSVSRNNVLFKHSSLWNCDISTKTNLYL